MSGHIDLVSKTGRSGSNECSSGSEVRKDSGESLGGKPHKRKGQRGKQKNGSKSRTDVQLGFDSIDEHIKSRKQMVVAGKKKQISIDHLLDFQSYRDSPEYQNNIRSNGRRRNNNHRNREKGQRSVILTGMNFINAHYKFVVDHRQNYRTQELDPNVPLDTKNIIRIIAKKGNACPICLTDEPVAPRMITSCGHILCLTCLLSLLDSEVPKEKKRENQAIIEKYRECPLCLSVIRKNQVKPVIISNIDERFETPKVNDEVVLTLMFRSSDNVLSLPKSIIEYYDIIGNFPWVSSTSIPDCSQYSRIFKGDLEYILKMYENEKEEITKNHQEEKLLYDQSDVFVNAAIKDIDNDIVQWIEDFKTNLTDFRKKENYKKDIHTSQFYFYQTCFNSSTTYVLSPLDIKVLKENYNNDYSQFPSTVVAPVENIRYEELTEETSITKLKYLSHLPVGTSIGFLECNWEHNEFISKEVWQHFQEDLKKRSKNSSRKLRKEEKDRIKALNYEEIRTRNFYARENNHAIDDDYAPMGRFGSLSITDNRELPPLQSEQPRSRTASNDMSSSPELQTTVWGTKIPKSDLTDDNSSDWEAEEMIRKAKEEFERQERENNGNHNGKRRKKKLILLSSNSDY